MVGLNLKLDVKFSNYKEFYIFYMAKHMKQTTRRLHVLGTLLAAGLLIASVIKGGSIPFAISAPLIGYGIAWGGDIAVERITPTSFRHPWWSFRANMQLVKEVLRGDQSV